MYDRKTKPRILTQNFAVGDSLNGGVGNAGLVAGTGNDWLYGGTGDDSLNDGEDNDCLYDEHGRDQSERMVCG